MGIEHLTAIQPLLTKFAVERQPAPVMGGRYCDDAHVWVQDTDKGATPIVLNDSPMAVMVTKTLTVQEQDDDHFIRVPELASKTEVQQESDDEITGLVFTGMVTKTYLELESDDQGGELL